MNSPTNTNTTNTTTTNTQKYVTTPIVIGKVPGYNSNINNIHNPTSKRIDYTERLKNNLTTISLKPTGYFIDFANIQNDLLNKTWLKSNNATGVSGAVSGLYHIGGDQTLGTQLKSVAGTQMPTSTALSNWNELVKTNIDSKSAEVNELKILATNDSTMTEVFSNNFEKSAADKLADSIANVKIFQKVRQLKAAENIDSTYGLALLKKGNFNSGALSLAAGKALGIQTSLPKEWVKSDYTNALQLMIKLVSPSGDSKSIEEYILKPLKFLTLAVSPITVDGINFGYPTLWEVHADGLMDMKLAGISAMTITRGGNETQFNRFNQPLNIDVRLTIEPLINGFASLTESTYNKNLSKTYQNFLVSNPGMLQDSFDTTNSQYQTIKL